MHQTTKALLARGLDSELAERLANDGHTLGKLKTKAGTELLSLGLPQAFIDALSDEARPPIPIDTLMSVLFANRFQCCVCRDPRLPVILHHIHEWAESRSHDADNLAVLCLHHHDEAHNKRALSKNLDASTLREMKRKWEAEVKRFDAESILEAMRLDYSNWNYINELRVFELAKFLNVDFDSIPHILRLKLAGLVEADGSLNQDISDELYYKYEGPNILHRYFYMKSVLAMVIARLSIINISDFLDKGVLGFSVLPGDFIFVQGAHVFSPIYKTGKHKGRGQICKGVRRANKVEVNFIFDRWEATSSSAQSCWLTGTRNQGSLIHVKDVCRDGGLLKISGTVLGICSNLGNLKNRDYAETLAGAFLHTKYDEEYDGFLDEADDESDAGY